MQFLKVFKSTTLSELGELVGTRNVSSMLVQNQLSRDVHIGEQFYNNCQEISSTSPTVPWQRKQVLLNKFVDDQYLFEEAALLSESGWKVMDTLNTFPAALSVPETIQLPYSEAIMGGGSPVGRDIYNLAMSQLADTATGNQIDPGIFNTYSSALPAAAASAVAATTGSGDIFQWFNIPWGDITLANLSTQESVDFPVYPEELEDKRTASYTTMPDILYQYEPWQIYQSSGPRSATYTFDMHRQMWTGNESDGKASELIRFCQAFLYPTYAGSAVNTSLASLYITGQLFISGIITDVSVTWDGPISGIDNFYLHFKLSLTFTEVSTRELNYDVVRNLPLIG